MGVSIHPVFGETTHLCRFVHSNGNQVPAEEEALEVTGSMSEFEDARPGKERDDFHDPVLPPAEGNSCRDEVVGEGEWVVKQVEEKTQDGSHVTKRNAIAWGVARRHSQ